METKVKKQDETAKETPLAKADGETTQTKEKVTQTQEKTEGTEEQNKDDEKTLENLKEQLAKANKKLKEFEGVDVPALQQQVIDLTAAAEQAEAQAQQKIADMQFENMLSNEIVQSKAKNDKAVKALLDLDSLKNSETAQADIKKAIENIKAENDYLFNGEVPPVYSQGTGSAVITKTQVKDGVEASFEKLNPNLFN